VKGKKKKLLGKEKLKKERGGGENKVESDFELHWTKRAKSGEGKLLIALALPFFFTIHSVHSLGKVGG
jgi:hypothetical protein